MTMAISCPSFQLFDNLWREINDDPDFHSLRDEGVVGICVKDWHVTYMLVIVAGLIDLSATSPSIPLALATAHGAEHEGVAKTLHRLHTDFHVSGACALVAEFVHAYAMCQRNKVEQLHPAGLLQPLEIPLTVWADITMDFI
jgi:hypothetical protein